MKSRRKQVWMWSGWFCDRKHCAQWNSPRRWEKYLHRCIAEYFGSVKPVFRLRLTDGWSTYTSRLTLVFYSTSCMILTIKSDCCSSKYNWGILSWRKCHRGNVFDPIWTDFDTYCRALSPVVGYLFVFIHVSSCLRAVTVDSMTLCSLFINIQASWRMTKTWEWSFFEPAFDKVWMHMSRTKKKLQDCLACCSLKFTTTTVWT